MFKGIKIDTFLIYSINQNFRKELINGLSKMLNENSLKHMISKTFSIDNIIEAHEAMESGNIIGNIVVEVS
jgi:NADPH2:quinone reductase